MARLLICVFLLTLAASIALGQGRVIDEATYTQVLESAGEYRLSENYRVKMITTVKSGPMTSEILEFEPPNKRRVRTFRIDRGELEPSSEWIFIEQTVYVKRQGLGWQVEERRQADMVKSRSEVTKVEYWDMGTEPSGSMKLFLRKVHAHLRADGLIIENTQTVKSWIDRGGKLRKEEYTSTNSKSGTTVLTMDYEVDPTIRIEAPIK